MLPVPPLAPDGFETERLLVAHWSHAPGAAVFLTELEAILTPAVLQDLPPALQVTQGIHAWVQARESESDVFALRERGTGALVGLLILATPAPGTAYIGYLVCQTAWGQGYASEVVQGLVKTVCNAGPMRIMAGATTSNTASIRVLEKAGFTRGETTGGTAHFALEIAAP